MWYISYWFWPVIAFFIWTGMLITMMVVWATEGYTHYSSMDPDQHIAYISDIGANYLRPLFISMSTATAVTFNVAFVAERWLRHTGRLTPNTSVWQKLYSLISVIAAIAGGVGLILLSIFDTIHHHRLHHVFLALFIIGYIISAIFICWEYQRLGVHYREHSILRLSFWVKLAFIIIEVGLAIGFGVCGKLHKYNEGAVLEWTVSFVFGLYVLSFFLDFMPAVRTKNHQSRETEMSMRGDGDVDGQGYFRGNSREHHTNGYGNGHTNGYTNGSAAENGYTNGHHANGNGYTNGHHANGNGYANGHKPTAPGHF